MVRGGGGAPGPGRGGKGPAGGRCPGGRGPRPGGAPSPGPAAIRKACLLGPGLKSFLARPRRPSAHGRSRERPLPKPKGAVGQGQGPLWLVGRAKRAEIRPSAQPTAPVAASDPPPRYLGSRSARGLRHKEVVVEGDARSLKGGIHFGHLGREEREKGREKGERKADGAS